MNRSSFAWERGLRSWLPTIFLVVITIVCGDFPVNASTTTDRTDPRGIRDLKILALNARTENVASGVVEIAVTAADAHGVGAVLVHLGDQSQTIPGRGQRTVTSIMRFRASIDTLVPLQAVAISLDGRTRGTPMVKLLSREVPATYPAGELPLDFFRRLADSDYPARLTANLPKVPPLVVNGDPWWRRWMAVNGPKAFRFDWLSRCGKYTPGITPNGEVLRCWLNLHPRITPRLVWHEFQMKEADTPQPFDGDHLEYLDAIAVDERRSYLFWTEDMRQELDKAFYWAWQYLDGGANTFQGQPLPPVPDNQLVLADDDIMHATVIGRDDAWHLYLGTIAHSLALEIGGFVPWSIVDYEDRDLATLFDSDLLLRAGSIHRPLLGYYWGYQGAPIVSAPPTFLFDFLVTSDLIRSHQEDSVTRLLEWSHAGHLFHAPEWLTALDAETLWGYRGDPPAARLIEGYQWHPQLQMKVGRVPGCGGMSVLARIIMRAINIPVEDGRTGPPSQYTHHTPIFWTIGKTLDHGDDFYSGLPSSTPPFPLKWLFITLDTYQDWFFGAGVLGVDGQGNVSRQLLYEIPLRALSDDLVQRYCADKANGASHADGTVAAYFHDEVENLTYYTAAQLEAKNLWTKLGAKAAALGYCSP